jgi:ribosomal protein S14
MNASALDSDEVMIVGESASTHEQSFIVKRQKRCNFCGNELPYPKKFTFQRKCPTCSLKNSTFIFPARFLCNSCLEGSHNDVHRVETDQIPLENLKNAEILHSDSLVRKLQSLVSRSIEVALRD